jgi:hypothetical protein
MSHRRQSTQEPPDRGSMMDPEIRGEHYSREDRLLLIAAGDALCSWAYDIATHEADGYRWDRAPDEDAVLMAAQLGWLLTAANTVLEQATVWYSQATDNARMRAADQ